MNEVKQAYYFNTGGMMVLFKCGSVRYKHWGYDKAAAWANKHGIVLKFMNAKG